MYYSSINYLVRRFISTAEYLNRKYLSDDYPPDKFVKELRKFLNNKVVKIPTENVKSIIANLNEEEEELQKRLLKAGVSYGKQSPVLIDINNLDSSPFQNLLKWPYNKQKLN